ncbi:GZMB isoform 8 [Pan troglodytes]|uniref:GZMB isoform 8 n=1 Tax=Pan troglodytes TaxID=9598 RepID=A0A2J8QKU9_PANTR|nr:GZMB isoform 8 [Pan troglodytes]
MQECSELQLPFYQDPPSVMLDKLSAGMAEQQAILKKSQGDHRRT